MFFKRTFVVAMVFVLVCAGYGAIFAEGIKMLAPDMAEKVIKNKMATIDNLVKQGRFEEALKNSENLENWVKTQRPEVISKHLEKIQTGQVEIQEKQGNYDAAAAKAEQAGKENKSAEIQKKAESSKQNVAAQKELFQKQMDFASKIHDKDMEIYNLVKKRDQALKELSGKKPEEISKAKLAELQSLMKKTASEIAAKEKERAALFGDWNSLMEKYKDVTLSSEMVEKLEDKIQNLEKIQENLKIAQQDINFRYEDLTANAKVGWTGFSDKLAETYKMQKDMLDLQKKMKELAGKGKLSGEDMKAFMALKSQYVQLKSQVDEKMNDLQKTFEDAKGFDDLNPEAAGRLKGLFQDVKKSRDFLAENEKKLDSMARKIDYHYGDVNGDGVVDQEDLAILQKIPQVGFKKALETAKGGKIDLLAADVDGDGRVTLNDRKLMEDKIRGIRKTFPVDPKNIPGDMNGNGVIDKADAKRLESAMKNPDTTMSSFKNVADMNGDGKVNDADKALFMKAQKAQEAKEADEDQKLTQDTTIAKDAGDQEKELQEKRQAPSSGNPFAKGKKNKTK